MGEGGTPGVGAGWGVKRQGSMCQVQGRKKEVVSPGDQQTPDATERWGQGQSSHSDCKLPECHLRQGERGGVRIRYSFYKTIWAVVWRLEVVHVEGQRKGVRETGGASAE